MTALLLSVALHDPSTQSVSAVQLESSGNHYWEQTGDMDLGLMQLGAMTDLTDEQIIELAATMTEE